MVLYFVPAENAARGLAAASILFTLLKATYDVWEKERERRKKEDERRERIKATPTFTRPVCGKMASPEVVGVELYNEGNAPVNIRRVFLIANGKTANLVTYDRQAIKTSKHPELFMASSVKLGPKEAACFHVRSDSRQFLCGILLDLAPGSLWIAVESYGGEVARVPGEQIQDLVRKAQSGKKDG